MADIYKQRQRFHVTRVDVGQLRDGKILRTLLQLYPNKTQPLMMGV